MKKAFLFFAIVILLFSGCHSDKVSDVVATTLPVYEFACTADQAAVAFLEEELRKELIL